MEDLQSAFSSVLESKESPTEKEESAEKKESAPANDPLNSLEEKQKEARERWKYEKRIKELESQLEERGKKKSIDAESENPLKELKKIKGWSHDDIVDKALEALEDDGMSKDEAKKELKQMSYEEIVAKVKEDLAKENESKNKQSEEIERAKKAESDFKEKIKTFAKESSEKYPLVDALGVTDNIYNMIEQDFISKEEEFGTDYAIKNMMKIEDAVKKVNESLATEIKKALKSDHVRKFISEELKEGSRNNSNSQSNDEDFQLEDDFATLTNDSYRRVTDPKDQREMTNEEALADAFKYL